MNEFYPIPFIVREHYESFLRLRNSDFPDTYDEWLDLIAQQKIQRGRIGFTVQEVRVDRDEFIRYCADRMAPNVRALFGFAVEKFHRNSN